MTWEKEELEREKHFDSLNCKCPRCSGKLKYVMMYEDFPQFYSGACKECGENFHFTKDGELIKSKYW